MHTANFPVVMAIVLALACAFLGFLVGVLWCDHTNPPRPPDEL
jgi:hypothetical protein